MNNELQRDIELWGIVREQMRSIVTPRGEADLMRIPPGLANNMLWIYGHVIRSADFLILRQGGRPVTFPAELDVYFQKGSSPAQWKEAAGLREKIFAAESACREGILKYLHSTDAASLHAEPYRTSMGFSLNTPADAVRYNLFHESLHLGQLQLYAKLV